MTWAKLDDKFHQDPQLQRLSRDTRLLYVEGLAYCAQQLTDGFIADYMLRKITDSSDPDRAAQELVDGGVWDTAEQDRDKGWQVVGYLTTQSSREEVEKARKLSAETTARNRRHKAGDHSTCIQGRYCPQGAVTRHVTGQSSSQSSPLDPTLSDPTPREGKERRSEAAPPAPLGSQERTSSKTKSAFTITMPAPDESSTPLVYTPPDCFHQPHGPWECGCPTTVAARDKYNRRLLENGVDQAAIKEAFWKWRTASSEHRRSQ